MAALQAHLRELGAFNPAIENFFCLNPTNFPLEQAPARSQVPYGSFSPLDEFCCLPRNRFLKHYSNSTRRAWESPAYEKRAIYNWLKPRVRFHIAVGATP